MVTVIAGPSKNQHLPLCFSSLVWLFFLDPLNKVPCEGQVEEQRQQGTENFKKAGPKTRSPE